MTSLVLFFALGNSAIAKDEATPPDLKPTPTDVKAPADDAHAGGSVAGRDLTDDEVKKLFDSVTKQLKAIDANKEHELDRNESISAVGAGIPEGTVFWSHLSVNKKNAKDGLELVASLKKLREELLGCKQANTDKSIAPWVRLIDATLQEFDDLLKSKDKDLISSVDHEKILQIQLGALVTLNELKGE